MAAAADMAAAGQQAAVQLLAQPAFLSRMEAVEAALAERQQGQGAAGVAAHIIAQKQLQTAMLVIATQAGDAVLRVLEVCGGAVPPAVAPALTSLLSFWHSDAPHPGPAAHLSREARVLLDPASRAAAAAFLADWAARGAPPRTMRMPDALLREGVTAETMPGGKACVLCIDKDGTLLLGGEAPAAEVPGLPGGPLNLQTLAFGLAVLEWKVPGLHPISLTLLDDPEAGDACIVCSSCCGVQPCLEPQHLRLMSRQIAERMAQQIGGVYQEQPAETAASSQSSQSRTH